MNLCGPRAAVLRPIALGLAAWCGGLAHGQVALFLQPSAASIEAGASVELRLRSRSLVADGPASPSAWPERIAWMFIRNGGAQDNRDAVSPVGEGGASHVDVTPGAPGCALIAVDFEPETITLPGAAFAEVLSASTGVAPDAALRTRAQVRVRCVRSAKALVRVTGGVDGPIDAATAVSKSGQAVEIRPFADPTLLAPGGEMPMRTYIVGDAFGSPRIRARSGESGVFVEPRVSPTPVLALPAAGPWGVEFSHAAALRDDPDADWVLYTATLTFTVARAGEHPSEPEKDR